MAKTMMGGELSQAQVLLELQELDTRIRNSGGEISSGKKRVRKKRKGKLIDLTRERKAKAKKIDKVLLDKYEELRNTVRNGIAVVSVNNGVCGGCHLALSTTQLQELETTERLQSCDYCGRMLVYLRARV